ncbi:lysozyme [Chryseobacterium gambrini]|uniref:Lysozyme n=1 Tax=Chryseobacterium gambrini TaxID=373672 RepID=A0AAJ1R481_9FLAO|nr:MULTISPECIES: lysozyme [Chryseobacterium]MDN4013691.1 lysozyme [Chryseobacterium gambrini]MDN4028056.1 lysozyme [Chryseobacterium gambrini]QWA39772.1 lysozyme [Chryseobacterium sp. ZHDP1]
MTTSQKGINFILSFEGFSAKPYLDSAGIPTIGYGNTYYPGGKKVTMKDLPITKEKGAELFASVLPTYEKIVSAKIKIQLTQNQFDALVSHTYNTGGSDTLFSLINKKADAESIRTWFTTKYTTAGGKVLAGLVRRRKAEADLFFEK